MTINTGQAPLTVNIRRQVVGLYPVRTERVALGRIWGSIFIVEVMLEAAVIIGPNTVTVMAAQALLISW